MNAKLLFLQFCFDFHIWHWILMLMWGKNHCPEYMYIFLSIGPIWLCFFYRVSVVREYAVTLNDVWWSRSYRIIQKSLKASTLSPIWLIFNINMSFWLMVCRDNSYSFQDKRFLFCILTVHMSERCPYYWDFCFG